MHATVLYNHCKVSSKLGDGDNAAAKLLLGQCNSGHHPAANNTFVTRGVLCCVLAGSSKAAAAATAIDAALTCGCPAAPATAQALAQAIAKNGCGPYSQALSRESAVCHDAPSIAVTCTLCNY